MAANSICLNVKVDAAKLGEAQQKAVRLNGLIMEAKALANELASGDLDVDLILDECDSLRRMVLPIVAYLRENYNPHCAMVITEDSIRIVGDELCIPLGRPSHRTL